MAVQIPFAYSLDLKRLVEVSAVRSGRACNCTCPSCGQSVIARKGDKNEWHFGHDSSPRYQPGQECEISFWVCCRQFIIDCAVNGLLPGFTTPPIRFTERYQRASTTLSELEWHPSDTGNYDLMAQVGGFTLHIYLSYLNRDNPFVPEDEARNEKVGAVEMSIQSLEKDIDRHARLVNGILKQAKYLFEGDLPGIKSWLCHPLEHLSEVQDDIKREKLEEETREKEERELREKVAREKAEAQARRAEIAQRIAYESGIRTIQAEERDRIASKVLWNDTQTAISRYPTLLKTIEADKRGNRSNTESTLIFLINRHRKNHPREQWPSESDLLGLYKRYRSGGSF